MEQRDIERLAKLEMTTTHHDKRLTILEDERREWAERIQDLSVATARLVMSSENLLRTTERQENKISVLENAKAKLIGWIAGASVVVGGIWTVVSRLFL